MDFLANIKNNSILVVPNNLKVKILKYINDNNLLINIKLLTFNDLKKGLLFDYTNEALFYIMNKKNTNLSVSKDFINNMYYLNEDNFSNSKLTELLELKRELENNNLLIKDPLFKSLLKSKSTLYYYGFSNINKLNKYLLDLASEYITIEEIKIESNNYKHAVHKLKHIEDEIVYVAENISKLIENKVSLKNIFIANYSSEYYFTIKKIFNLYKIPVYLKNETKLSDTYIGKYFINNLSNNIESLLYKISKKFDIENNETNEAIYNKLTNLVNTYYWTNDFLSIKNLINEEMKLISIPNKHYEEEILTTNIIDNEFGDNEYIFLIGFNQGSIPKTYKDEDYITDNIKTNLMETTVEKNNNSKNSYLESIKNIKNLTITYKELTIDNKFLVSPLVDDNYLTIEETKNIYSNYSEDYNKLLYAMKLDDLIKFNEQDENLSILHYNYNIPYKEYKNDYTGIDKEKIRAKFDLSLEYPKKFSYSNISIYYKCPFRFYLDNFYKLDEFETTIDTFIGGLFHKVLEECINDETKDIDEVYDQFINDNKDSFEFRIKEQYYVEKVREEIHFIIDNIKKQYEYSSHDPKLEEHEKKIELTTDDLDLNTNIKTIIKGFVDKCLVINNDIVIIDYKTGNSDKVDRTLFEFGIDIQLPIYLYLLKNENKNYNIVGMYLQHIMQGLIYKENNKSIEDVRFDNLKLDGITLDDKEKINLFDSNYEKSNIIKGLGISSKTNDWSYKNRLISYEEQEELYNTTKTHIENCINNVADANFIIKPINIKGSTNGCDYCKYRDICFRKESDVNTIILEGSDTDE